MPTTTQSINVVVLGDRQRDVLIHSIQGKSAGEIAALLGISVNTVYTHRRSIVDRLGVRRAQWRRVAIERGLIDG